MHLNHDRKWPHRTAPLIFICALLALLAVVMGACAPAAQPADVAPAAEATEAPAAEPEPTEEPAAEPTEEPAAEPALAGDPLDGQYMVTLTGGCGCHFNRELGALAGGNRFERPFGVVHSSNITPDPATGIGNWSEQEIAHVLRTGARPDGTQLAAVMPYRRFSVLSDREALAVAAYLLSLEPVTHEVPPPEFTTEPQPFTPAVEPPAEPPTDPVARGEQLVTLADCAGCHTPVNEDGSRNQEMHLAGATLTDEISSNITPDEETGIGAWTEQEIVNLLLTGMRPDGSETEGSMAQQVDRRFSQLTEADAMAIAAYLKSIPAVHNDPFQQ